MLPDLGEQDSRVESGNAQDAEGQVTDALPDARAEEDVLAEVGEMQAETEMEGTMSALDFKEYEVLYVRWKRSVLSNLDVIAIGGKNLLDLMEAPLNPKALSPRP